MKKIKLFDPIIGKPEENAVKKVLQSHYWSSGSGSGKVYEFENKFKKYINSNSVVALNSGTAALHLALSLYNLKNKEVILPSLSFVSTAHAILYNGGIPVFADISNETLCLDPEKVKKKITKKTAAIIPVHFAGMSSDLDEFAKISQNYKVPIIEDAAHACGAKYNGKKIGLHSPLVCFSFHPVKNLAMPGGGLIAINHSDNKKMKKILDSKRWCGITNRKGVKYDVNDLGWNYYMNEFSASIGIIQLSKLDKLNQKRKSIAKMYNKKLNIQQKMIYNNNCSYHFFWITIPNREKLRRKLEVHGIETGIHYNPIHKMSMYNSRTKLPNTENITSQIVTLPTHPNLTRDDVNLIVELIYEFVK